MGTFEYVAFAIAFFGTAATFFFIGILVERRRLEMLCLTDRIAQTKKMVVENYTNRYKGY